MADQPPSEFIDQVRWGLDYIRRVYGTGQAFRWFDRDEDAPPEPDAK